MKILVVVLALACLVQAEPEADPYYLYHGYYGLPYAYPYFYGHSAYEYELPGGGSTKVSRLHKRDAAVLYTGSNAPGLIPPTLPADGTLVAPHAFPHSLRGAVTAVTPGEIEATVNTVVPAVYSYAHPYIYGRRKREADAAVLATGSAVVGSLAHAYALPAATGPLGPPAIPAFPTAAVTAVTPGEVTATVHHTAYAYPYAYHPYHFGYYGK